MQRQRPGSATGQTPAGQSQDDGSVSEARQELERVTNETEHLLNAAVEAQAKDQVPRGTFQEERPPRCQTSSNPMTITGKR